MTKELNGINYVEYLRRRLMLGQVDPWRRTDDGKPMFTILVPVDTALAECSIWSGQDIPRVEFINYLKLNDVLCFRNIDEFAKAKTNWDDAPMKLKKKEISPERRKALQIQAKIMREKSLVTTRENGT